MKNGWLAAPGWLFALALMSSCGGGEQTNDTWQVAGGNKKSTRFSSLNQINASNVKSLEVAWLYSSGDKDTVNNSQIQCNPIIVDGVLYATSPQLKLLAIDAATGDEKWRFDPQAENSSMSPFLRFIMNNNRGVTWWSDGDDRRILYTVGSVLYAIDATTGKSVKSFGKGGYVDLHEGLGRDVNDLYVASTSPGIVYKNLFIIGSRVSEGSDAAPGHIRAYDARTGEQKWIFHTIPQPGEFGFDSWEDSTAWKHIGGANAWSGFSLDEERGLLFVPTGSASFDFYGGKRLGNNLFANCLLVLDAGSGSYRWHFQFVHHDVWDRDLPTPPALVTITKDGKKIDAVAQPTKFGFIYLFERETGKPIFPIEEQPVPTTTELKGEKLSPTQPLPTLPKSFMRQTFTEADLNKLVPDSSYQRIRQQFLSYDKGHLFTPPSLRGTIFYPGLDGGAEWGGPAFDPETNRLYVNANEIPWAIGMMANNLEMPSNENHLQAGQRLYTTYCMPCHGKNREGAGNYPTLIGVEKKYSEKTFTDLLSTGRRMMPAMSHIPAEERTAIASFVLNLKSIQSKPYTARQMAIDSFRNLPYSITGYTKFQTPEGYPAIAPPWGTLNAINLATGEIDWRITLGSHPDFKNLKEPTGTENYGGPLVTSGGLVFIGATMDGKFRAFDKNTGALLWETELPASAFATPATYSVNGRQFVVIACGGGKLGTRSSDVYIAFALPKQ